MPSKTFDPDSASSLRDVVGDDATATFEDDPNFVESNPTGNASTESVEVQRDTDDVEDSDEEEDELEDDDEEFEDEDDSDEDEDVDDDDDEEDEEDDADEVAALAVMAAGPEDAELDDDEGDVDSGVDEDELDEDELDTDRVTAEGWPAASLGGGSYLPSRLSI